MRHDVNIDLWFWNYTATTAEQARWRTLLTADEQARLDRFSFEEDRQRFVVCRSRLRRVLGWMLKTPPRELVFSTIARGKPVVETPNGASVQFNLSHTADLACLAVTQDAQVGVDVERHREVRDEFIEFALNPAERTAVLTLQGNEKTAAFFQAWTAKEAYLKGIGMGLGQSLKSFDIDLSASMPASLQPSQQAVALPAETAGFIEGHLTRIDRDADRHETWRLFTFRPCNEVAGALAVAAPAQAEVKVTSRWLLR